jgi:hypothetical protein
MFKKFTQIWQKINKKRSFLFKHFLRKKASFFSIPKRQKFIISVIISSLILFFSEQIFGKGGLYISIILSIFTGFFIFWAEKEDLRDNFSPQIFILPLFYTLACALFYFLVPAIVVARIGMAFLYALGLYALLLSENIFIVSSIRTIALLSSARTVSFVITILSFFFLSNVVFSLHFNIVITLLLIFIFSFPLALHSAWSHTLDRNFRANLEWIMLIAVCLTEIAFVLWFWSTSPTIIALFLTGLFYILIGISQVWLDKRLFKGVMWEYVWVAVIVFLIFATFGLQSS